MIENYTVDEQMSLFDLDIWCGKMSPEPSQVATQKGQTSQRCLKKPSKSLSRMPMWMCLTRDGHIVDASVMSKADFPLPGEYTMHSFGEFPKEENASHLSQILEECPHPKYYLSARACQGILNRAAKRGKDLPEILKDALMEQIEHTDSTKEHREM